ncbi:phospholipid-translocating P-type ATPase, flippase family protein [Trichomonas vaginalis G3]|uniref:Phospholipid-transporting ATPase n=1 Tax=Trichomonas vaginalis (strain ATCC PRA-98 / G3) TaxID=412133 RepID=A2DID3_TRIV3|nr:putative phospholipid-transporting ATPase family [Trichomonas vaginalis G3]EAY19929.1 phospholipid-translocating P-type ATPase, flippase family protein [Trichomonas vaginalis G3]KAI5509936.1 putative phospholipid-transporting ATPase family [Trichomonas vaginalis G3]|eukprot:XP_001580915.1 phospholipid-translocating P-type ATPase, flippase family protein [Trichomonas vaginalis G3]
MSEDLSNNHASSETTSVDAWATIKFLQPSKNYPGQKGNFIRTTRYTWWSFLPLSLLENYRSYTNIYFIIVLIICALPLSPVNYLFTLCPMLVVLAISMIRAGIEDLMKYVQDRRRNNAPVKIYSFGEWVDSISADIRAGDVILVENEQSCPVDMLYLTSSNVNQSANFSMAELNGEATVQTIYPHPHFKGKQFPQAITHRQYEVDVPEPDRDLYKFNAKLKSETDIWPISINNILLRGTSLKYTDWAIGVALRTGHDCKIMMNQRHPPAKMTQFDKDNNTMVLCVFIFKMITVFIISGCCCYFEMHNDFNLLDTVMPSAFKSFWEAFLQYFVLFSYLIPLSLNCTIEICRLFLMFIISYDKYIVEEDRGKSKPHNSSMLGNLGLVTHVLTDKTGTLTENVMQLKEFTDSNGTFTTAEFIKSYEKDAFYSERSLEMLRALALCNTVIVYESKGTLEYNSESPDESAFVKFASEAGVALIQHDQESITLDELGKKVVYKVHAVLPFNSTRKRMSIIVQREGDSNAIIYTKGADNVIYQRAASTKYNNEVNEFSAEGLRTLVFSSRILEDEEIEKFVEEYKEAAASLDNREQKLDSVATSIEKNLNIIGVTGVEDRLQPCVPEAILWLRHAGIKCWVLTGDKLETAIEIGKTSSVILPGADTLILSSSREEETLKSAKCYRDNFDNFKDPVLCLTENATTLLIEKEPEDIIYLCKKVKSVIFCRSTPFMKARIVRLVKSFKGSLTLAIGDGANDVGMIQESHVGVGISGLEGNQAAMTSDFAIPRFRHLIRLIAVHGHWAFDRFAWTAMIMIYKNIVFSFSMLWMAIDTMGSPSSFYDSFFMSCFNLLFTMIPPFIYGWIEQDLPEAQLVRYPQLHRTLPNPMTPPLIAYFCGLGVYQSIIVYYVIRLTMPSSNFTENGFFSYFGVVLIVSVMVSSWLRYWCWVTFLANFGTLFVAILVIMLYGAFMEPEIMSCVLVDMTNPRTYLMMILVMILGLIPPIFLEFCVEHFGMRLNRLLRERRYIDIDGPIDFAEAMKQESEFEEMTSISAAIP